MFLFIAIYSSVSVNGLSVDAADNKIKNKIKIKL